MDAAVSSAPAQGGPWVDAGVCSLDTVRLLALPPVPLTFGEVDKVEVVELLLLVRLGRHEATVSVLFQEVCDDGTAGRSDERKASAAERV